MREDKRDALYWQVMHADSLKKWTKINDSLLDDFIIYCDQQFEDKSRVKSYYYKEKVIELYPIFLEERKP